MCANVGAVSECALPYLLKFFVVYFTMLSLLRNVYIYRRVIDEWLIAEYMEYTGGIWGDVKGTSFCTWFYYSFEHFVWVEKVSVVTVY